MSTQLREALLRIAEVQARTGISRSQLYELVNSGKFPPPIPLVGRTRAWVESDVSEWISSRIEAARAAGGTR